MNHLQRIYHEDACAKMEELRHLLDVALQEDLTSADVRVSILVGIEDTSREVNRKLHQFDVLMLHNCRASFDAA